MAELTAYARRRRSIVGLLTMTEVQAFQTLIADGRVLMLTRMVRLLAFGFLSMVFAPFLAELGLTERQIGLVLMLMLVMVDGGQAVLPPKISPVLPGS